MCSTQKPLTDYYKHPKMALGVLGRCKVCHKYEINRLRAENPEKYRKRDRMRGQTVERRKQIADKNKRKRAALGPIYDKAHNAFTRAVKKGTLIMPDHCSRCLVQCRPQGHHDDYNKPLDVMWLCPICHAARHGELGRLRGSLFNAEDKPTRPPTTKD